MGGFIAQVIAHDHPELIRRTRQSQEAADAFLRRLSARKEDRDVPISNETIQAQLTAIHAWGAMASARSGR
jgi:hypothetical protein